MLQSDWYGAPNEYAYVNTLYTHFIIPRTWQSVARSMICDAVAYMRLLPPMTEANFTNAYKTCDWDKFLSDCNGDYTDPSAQCKTAVLQALSYLPSKLDVCCCVVTTPRDVWCCVSSGEL